MLPSVLVDVFAVHERKLVENSQILGDHGKMIKKLIYSTNYVTIFMTQ